MKFATLILIVLLLISVPVTAFGNDDPAKLLERGMLAIKDGKYKEAAQTLGRILKDHSSSPVAAQARTELDKLTEMIKKANDVRLESLESRLDQLKAMKKTVNLTEIKDPWEQAMAALDRAKHLHSQALQAESSRFSRQARRSWTESEKLLAMAQNNLNGLLKMTKDTQMIQSCKEKIKEARTWLIKVYVSLAQTEILFAGDRSAALQWTNKALAIDPFDGSANDLKQTLVRGSLTY